MDLDKIYHLKREKKIKILKFVMNFTVHFPNTSLWQELLTALRETLASKQTTMTGLGFQIKLQLQRQMQ